MLAPPNQGSEVVDRFGWLPGFTLLNGPAGQQLGTGNRGLPRKLGRVEFELGVIAGTRTINFILSQVLPNPDDGKVSVESARVEGMCAFMTWPVFASGHYEKPSGAEAGPVLFYQWQVQCGNCGTV